MGPSPSGTILQAIRDLFTDGNVAGLGDGQLLEQFAMLRGDARSTAFAALVKRHGPMVYRVCRDVLRDGHDAEDAFQATFFILARKGQSIRHANAIGPWLHGVAYNVAVTAKAEAARRRLRESKALSQRPEAAPQADTDHHDIALVIHDELGRLPERYRPAMILCCLEGLTLEQAAQRLGWPLGTVHSRVARGRERLRARLLRRGIAPALALGSPSTQAGVPAALENAAVGLVGSGTIPVVTTTGIVIGAIPTLARKAMNAMLLNRLLPSAVAIAFATVLIAVGTAVFAYQKAQPSPAKTDNTATPLPAPAAPGLLSATGTVRMPDGSPAALAVVTSMPAWGEQPIVVRADNAGRFRIDSAFGNGTSLHASTADGAYQGILHLQSREVRPTLTSALELTLAPAVKRAVTVVAGDEPAAGAHVVGIGLNFLTRGVTGDDGRVVLSLPPTGELQRLAASHPKLGVGGVEERDEQSLQDPLRLTLQPAKPRTVRVLDHENKPVGDLELALNINVKESGWVIADRLAETHVRTNAEGTATVAWMPAGKLEYVEVEIVGNGWQIDSTEFDPMHAETTTVHVRPLKTVEGRLIMPQGTSAEGILISGNGFGPDDHGHIPYARAQRDGTFALRIPAGYAFVLGLDDIQWASDPWSGVILGNDSSKPAQISIKAYPATPLTVHVTGGPQRTPLAHAWINLTTDGRVSWTDKSGKIQHGTSGVRTWLVTDAMGVAKAGVGRGPHHLRLSAGDWNEEKAVKVSSADPVAVEFHRAWSGERKVRGQLLLSGKPYKPSTTLTAYGWAPQPGTIPHEYKPAVHADGTFDASFDVSHFSLLFIDREQHCAGFAQVGPEAKTVDVSLEPTCTYAGVLFDPDDRPMADRPLTINLKLPRAPEARSAAFVDPEPSVPIGTIKTDGEGRFRFTDLPASLPLVLGFREDTSSGVYHLDKNCVFTRGEVRENDRIKAKQSVPSTNKASVSIPLAHRIADACGNAHVMRMHVLVVLQGDESGSVVSAANRLIDYDRNPDVLSNLTVHVNSVQLAADAATVADLGWPKPAPGEVVMVVLDGNQRFLGSQRIATADLDAAVASGDVFIAKHRPPARDARRVLAEARREAQRSGRRVWLIVGGPRCGPCFRLARWMADHHAQLERDYVVLEVLQGVDTNDDAVIDPLPIKQGDGIPWHAITEPDGTILTTSVSPSGNIGFPGSTEGRRHLRTMLERTTRRLTPDDVARLVESLSVHP